MADPTDDPSDEPAADAKGQPGSTRPSGLDEVADAVRGVQQRVSELANRWLEGRFAMRDGESPMGVASEIGARAEQFVRGFFRGLVDEPPGGGEAATAHAPEASAGQALKDAVPGMEQAARLLTKTTRTVTDTFQDYLRENAVDREHPDAPVVIDGRFVIQHGTQLIGRIVQALGGALAGERGAASERVDTEGGREADAKVPVKLDFAGLFRSLVMGSPPPERREPPSPEPGPEADDGGGEGGGR